MGPALQMAGEPRCFGGPGIGHPTAPLALLICLQHWIRRAIKERFGGFSSPSSFLFPSAEPWPCPGWQHFFPSRSPSALRGLSIASPPPAHLFISTINHGGLRHPPERSRQLRKPPGLGHVPPKPGVGTSDFQGSAEMLEPPQCHPLAGKASCNRTSLPPSFGAQSPWFCPKMLFCRLKAPTPLQPPPPHPTPTPSCRLLLLELHFALRPARWRGAGVVGGSWVPCKVVSQSKSG